MKSPIRNCFVLFLALIAGMVWLDAQAAKPVKVTVTSAYPDNAIQGDLVEVVDIEGTGFDDGSTARFLVTDSRDDTQIDVLEVNYVNPNKLKAKIKVKDSAQPVFYDIEVKTSSGRRGKGTTLFRVQEREGQDDPCLTSTSPFPAFMFWRELDSANDSNWGIFLASEDGVCVRQLLEIPDSSAAWMWELSFSYDQLENRGYATWIRRGTYETQEEDSIWLLEFWALGNTVVAQSEPELIIILPDNDETEAEAYLPGLDVSKDLQNLAFTYVQLPNDPEANFSQVHIFDIEACRIPNLPCMPGADSLIRDPGHLYNQGQVAWGPLGERLYLDEQEDASGDPPGPARIQMVTNDGGEWVDRVLLSSYDYPEYTGINHLSSGIVDGREKLAFRHDGDCRTISVIDVADCEEGITCVAESQFYGYIPRLTDRGTIVHKIVERVKTHPRKEIYECRYSDFIGEYDPVTSEVTPLVEGKDPDTR